MIKTKDTQAKYKTDIKKIQQLIISIKYRITYLVKTIHKTEQ